MSSLHAAGWQLVGASATAIIGVLSSLYIANKNRRQLMEHGAAQLRVQQATNERAAASFIGEKRQKWIDDLRSDVSLYIALTGEMVEGWSRHFERLGNEWDNHPPTSPSHLENYNEAVRKFADGYAERESRHTELLARIALRLNNRELAHEGLAGALHKIRRLLLDLNDRAARNEYNIREIRQRIDEESRFALGFARVILKEEWQRIKRDLADPDRLLNKIRATNSQDDATLKAAVESDAKSAPSVLSGDR
ncbi:hypothetical protein [Burkholderia gladioli]|uniref:hypothetical protein n=1 Tax=Burkholderia gladioli TaxID=28095 RepID=UPI0034DAC73B